MPLTSGKPTPIEHVVRINLNSKFPAGIAEIQCMYAPEFNSHSESFTLEVR